MIVLIGYHSFAHLVYVVSNDNQDGDYYVKFTTPQPLAVGLGASHLDDDPFSSDSFGSFSDSLPEEQVQCFTMTNKELRRLQN